MKAYFILAPAQTTSRLFLRLPVLPAKSHSRVSAVGFLPLTLSHWRSPLRLACPFSCYTVSAICTASRALSLILVRSRSLVSRYVPTNSTLLAGILPYRPVVFSSCPVPLTSILLDSLFCPAFRGQVTFSLSQLENRPPRDSRELSKPSISSPTTINSGPSARRATTTTGITVLP